MNAKGHHIENNEEFYNTCKPGDWTFIVNEDNAYTHIVVYLPLDDPMQAIAALPIVEMVDNHAMWRWDGNTESPTLTPSILHHSKPEWHGWMTEGELISV
jgi:oligoribonuclease NrnB/cAMP/cGMP phosphodiesterase (DHH superfamily)